MAFEKAKFFLDSIESAKSIDDLSTLLKVVEIGSDSVAYLVRINEQHVAAYMNVLIQQDIAKITIISYF